MGSTDGDDVAQGVYSLQLYDELDNAIGSPFSLFTTNLTGAGNLPYENGTAHTWGMLRIQKYGNDWTVRSGYDSGSDLVDDIPRRSWTDLVVTNAATKVKVKLMVSKTQTGYVRETDAYFKVLYK
jgi:hypothetical protein